MGTRGSANTASAVVAVLSTFCWVGSLFAADSVPRLPDGRPDLNGTWDNGSGIDFIQPQKKPDGSICIAGCEPAPGSQP